jgi:2-octaprenyl-6-methoxyphenol hydroxylase
MTHDTDVLIAGAGLNGGTLALALSGAGLRVTLVDPVPASTRGYDAFDGRSYALSLASANVLRALGLWSKLSAQAQPILHIKVSDGRPGEAPSPFVMEFDHGEIEEGPMGWMVEDRHLRPVLIDAIAQSGIEVVEGRRIVAQDPSDTGITATLDDGAHLSAVLLVGADGRMSGTATRAGIRHVRWVYNQTSLVAAIAHEKPHDGIAHQLFLPPGPLAILPLKGNRSSIVWTETTTDATRITALDDAAFLDHLRPRFGSFLGEISLAGARFSYPLGLSLAHHFTAPRVALLGDAAHAVHPLAGQGLNAGLKDVATLAEVLTDALRRGEDFGREDVLTRYQSWRRFDAVQLAIATDTFNRLFSNDRPALRLVRDLGLGLVGALPALRRAFIREAAGLTGDLPRLSRGQPL